MKAIILAAGIGSRLQPMTNTTPKCLVKTAGQPILKYQLDAFISSGIEDITIVAGYFAQQVVAYVEEFKKVNKTNAEINVIINENYNSTNNMFSLGMANSKLKGEKFILINGDVAIDRSIVIDLLKSEEDDLIASDKGEYNDESMKIIVKDDFVKDISKIITESEAYGNSIDLYKFSSNSSTILFNEIERVVNSGNHKDWTEVAIQRLLKSGELKSKPFDIQNRKWYEIDNLEDLSKSDKLFNDYSF